MTPETITIEFAHQVQPEFRLYYDNDGTVLFYTCEKPEGNYLVIDAQTYAEGRHDVKVFDGKIVKNWSKLIVAKLTESTTGTKCCADDLSIIVGDDYIGDVKTWEIKVYEL